MTKEKYAVSNCNNFECIENGNKFSQTDYNESSRASLPLLSVDSFALFGRPSIFRSKWWRKIRKKIFSWIGKIILFAIYACYMIYAIWYHPDNVLLLVFDCCICIIWVAAHAEKSRKVFILAGKKIVKVHKRLKVKIPFLRA